MVFSLEQGVTDSVSSEQIINMSLVIADIYNVSEEDVSIDISYAAVGNIFFIHITLVSHYRKLPNKLQTL